MGLGLVLALLGAGLGLVWGWLNWFTAGLGLGRFRECNVSMLIN